jgi:hypothetical protein
MLVQVWKMASSTAFSSTPLVVRHSSERLRFARTSSRREPSLPGHVLEWHRTYARLWQPRKSQPPLPDPEVRLAQRFGTFGCSLKSAEDVSLSPDLH